jgi:prefoldin subunit 5
MDRRTITEDGITLTKTYETDEFPVPTVDFCLRSERDDEATVRLVDTIPEGVPAADLGFHPDYGGDDWTVEGDSAVFEHRLAADEEYRTVYGVRTDDHDPGQFMTDPMIEVDDLGGERSDADDTDDPAATPGRDSSQAARDVIAGDRDVAGLDGDDTVEEVDISGAEAAAADGTGGSSGTNTADGQARDGGVDTGDVGVTEGGVGAALAAELRAGDLAAADRELLAAELDTDDAGSEVRLTHLQSRISDLEAYTDALEEFIDENGPARQLIEDLTEQVATIEDELTALDERTSETEAAIERLDAAVETNADDIEALDENIDDTEGAIDTTQESVAELRTDVEEIEEWRERISSVLGGVSEGS